MHSRTYIHTNIRIYAHILTHTYTYKTHRHTYIHIDMRIHTYRVRERNIYPLMDISTLTQNTCKRIHIHPHIPHIYGYLHMNTHTKTYIYKPNRQT